MEAFHWQFHPAAHRFREILDEGVGEGNKFGRIVNTEAVMTATPAIPPSDIRWKYELSGGILMDMTYVLSFTRYALRAELPMAVIFARAEGAPDDPRVDQSMRATLTFQDSRTGSNVASTIYTDMKRGWAYGLVPRVWELPSIRVETEQAEIYFYNAMMPHIYHYIGITNKATGETKYENMYKGGPLWKNRGEEYWSTYRYQLEAFVDMVRGKEPVWWIDGEEGINQMKAIDTVYKKAGLPLRPTSLLASTT